MFQFSKVGKGCEKRATKYGESEIGKSPVSGRVRSLAFFSMAPPQNDGPNLTKQKPFFLEKDGGELEGGGGLGWIGEDYVIVLCMRCVLGWRNNASECV